MAEPSAFIEPTLLPDALAGAVADAAAHPERTLKVVDLYKAAIGPRQQAYYLKQFARQEAGPGWRLGWHWPAFFSALNWFIFRKMWVWAGRYAALLGALAVASLLVSEAWGLTRMEAVALGAAAWGGASVVAGLLANALYYRHCMALIHGVLVNGADREAAAEVLADQSSGNRRFSGQVLVNVALSLFLPALATFAPWNGLDAWSWLTEAPAMQEAPKPPVMAASPNALADGERRVLPPGTATPTLKITSAEPQAPVPVPAAPPAADVPPSANATPIPLTEMSPTEPLVSVPPAPVSEALASTQAGLVLPGDPVPVTPALVAAAKPAVKETVKPPLAVAAPASVKPAPVPAAGAFGVQVGIFAQPANVANVLTQLKAQGLPVYTDAISMAGQPRTRVRVGPYGGADGREAALRAAAQIAELGLPAVVVPLPAAAAATVGR